MHVKFAGSAVCSAVGSVGHTCSVLLSLCSCRFVHSHYLGCNVFMQFGILVIRRTGLFCVSLLIVFLFLNEAVAGTDGAYRPCHLYQLQPYTCLRSLQCNSLTCYYTRRLCLLFQKRENT
jgi:hypothetical protein